MRAFSLLLATAKLAVGAADALKVFVLAGQSNMVGMASIDHLDDLVKEENEFRDALCNKDDYKIRDDVYIKFGDNHGNLTVSRSGLYAYADSFGPELMFGWTMGDAVDEKVLLIKTAWGGKSLAVDFRPPSSGPGVFAGVNPFEYGVLYREMIVDILETLDNLSEYVPDYDNEGYELAGFVWFHGWNDLINRPFVEEYANNLANFIGDVREDLDAPDLPFVIGELGMHGLNYEGSGADRVAMMRDAQRKAPFMKDFRSTNIPRFVRTTPYAGPSGTSYDGVYHYFGRADAIFHIGQAFGEGMLQLLGSRLGVDD